jgi:hypothetical protein
LEVSRTKIAIEGGKHHFHGVKKTERELDGTLKKDEVT